MFIFLDKKREKFNQWLKRKTTIDFSDWGVLVLFLIGLFAIFYLEKDIEIENKILAIVLWFTAIIILQYTKETYWLKQVQNKQIKEIRKSRYLEKMPMIRLVSWDVKGRDLSLLRKGGVVLKSKEEENYYKIVYKNIGEDWAFIKEVSLWVANPISSHQKKINIEYPSYKKTLYKDEEDEIATYRIKIKKDGYFLYPSKLEVVFSDRYNNKFKYIAKKGAGLSEPTPFLGIRDFIEEEVIYPPNLK